MLRLILLGIFYLSCLRASTFSESMFSQSESQHLHLNQPDRSLKKSEFNLVYDFVENLGIRYKQKPFEMNAIDHECKCKEVINHDESLQYPLLSRLGYGQLLRTQLYAYMHDWADYLTKKEIMPTLEHTISDIDVVMIDSQVNDATRTTKGTTSSYHFTLMPNQILDQEFSDAKNLEGSKFEENKLKVYEAVSNLMTASFDNQVNKKKEVIEILRRLDFYEKAYLRFCVILNLDENSSMFQTNPASSSDNPKPTIIKGAQKDQKSQQLAEENDSLPSKKYAKKMFESMIFELFFSSFDVTVEKGISAASVEKIASLLQQAVEVEAQYQIIAKILLNKTKENYIKSDGYFHDRNVELEKVKKIKNEVEVGIAKIVTNLNISEKMMKKLKKAALYLFDMTTNEVKTFRETSPIYEKPFFKTSIAFHVKVSTQVKNSDKSNNDGKGAGDNPKEKDEPAGKNPSENAAGLQKAQIFTRDINEVGSFKKYSKKRFLENETNDILKPYLPKKITDGFNFYVVFIVRSYFNAGAVASYDIDIKTIFTKDSFTRDVVSPEIIEVNNLLNSRTFHYDMAPRDFYKKFMVVNGKTTDPNALPVIFNSVSDNFKPQLPTITQDVSTCKAALSALTIGIKEYVKMSIVNNIFGGEISLVPLNDSNRNICSFASAKNPDKEVKEEDTLDPPRFDCQSFLKFLIEVMGKVRNMKDEEIKAQSKAYQYATTVVNLIRLFKLYTICDKKCVTVDLLIGTDYPLSELPSRALIQVEFLSVFDNKVKESSPPKKKPEEKDGGKGSDGSTKEGDDNEEEGVYETICFKISFSFGDIFKSDLSCSEQIYPNRKLSPEEYIEALEKLFSPLISDLESVMVLFSKLAYAQLRVPAVKYFIDQTFASYKAVANQDNGISIKDGVNAQIVNQKTEQYKIFIDKFNENKIEVDSSADINGIQTFYLSTELLKPLKISAKIYINSQSMIVIELKVGSSFFEAAVPQFFFIDPEQDLAQIIGCPFTFDFKDFPTVNYIIVEDEAFQNSKTTETDNKKDTSDEQKFEFIDDEKVEAYLLALFDAVKNEANSDKYKEVLNAQRNFWVNRYIASLLAWIETLVGKFTESSNIDLSADFDEDYRISENIADDLPKVMNEPLTKALVGLSGSSGYLTLVNRNLYAFELAVAFVHNAIINFKDVPTQIFTALPDSSGSNNDNWWTLIDNCDPPLPTTNKPGVNEDGKTVSQTITWEFSEGSTDIISKECQSKFIKDKALTLDTFIDNIASHRYQQDFNYVFFLYGLTKISKKLSVRIFELRANLLSLVKVMFRTEYFAWEYIFSFDSYPLLWHQTQEAVKEVLNHYTDVHTKKTENAGNIMSLKSEAVIQQISTSLHRLSKTITICRNPETQKDDKDTLQDFSEILFYIPIDEIYKLTKLNEEQVPSEKKAEVNIDVCNSSSKDMFKAAMLIENKQAYQSHKYKLQFFSYKDKKTDQDKSSWNKVLEHQQYSFNDQYEFDYTTMIKKYVETAISQLFLAKKAQQKQPA